MIDAKLPVTIFQPEASIEAAKALMQLRTELYTAQLQDAGIPEMRAQAHVAPWAYPIQAELYLDMLRYSERYYCRGLLLAGELVGIFVGDLEPGKGTVYGNDDQLEESKYVAEIQLSPSIQRQGFGGQLMAGFVELDDRPTTLHVFDNNFRARRFYKQQGFQETGFKANVEISGQELGRRLLKKQGDKRAIA